MKKFILLTSICGGMLFAGVKSASALRLDISNTPIAKMPQVKKGNGHIKFSREGMTFNDARKELRRLFGILEDQEIIFLHNNKEINETNYPTEDSIETGGLYKVVIRPQQASAAPAANPISAREGVERTQRHPAPPVVKVTPATPTATKRRAESAQKRPAPPATRHASPSEQKAEPPADKRIINFVYNGKTRPVNLRATQTYQDMIKVATRRFELNESEISLSLKSTNSAGGVTLAEIDKEVTVGDLDDRCTVVVSKSVSPDQDPLMQTSRFVSVPSDLKRTAKQQPPTVEKTAPPTAVQEDLNKTMAQPSVKVAPPAILEPAEAESDDLEAKFGPSESRPTPTYTFTRGEEEFKLDIPESATVLYTKEIVARKFGCTAEDVKLLHCGKELKNTMVLARQKIKAPNRILVYIREMAAILLQSCGVGRICNAPKPPDYNERLAQLQRETGQDARSCLTCYQYHNYDYVKALNDLLEIGQL